jgi:hypothetical protein
VKLPLLSVKKSLGALHRLPFTLDSARDLVGRAVSVTHG